MGGLNLGTSPNQRVRAGPGRRLLLQSEDVGGAWEVGGLNGNSSSNQRVKTWAWKVDGPNADSSNQRVRAGFGGWAGWMQMPPPTRT